MKIGIVGSRRRNTFRDWRIVSEIFERALESFGTENLEFVSGGALEGADAFCKEIARALETKYTEFPIDRSTPIPHKGEFIKRAYARNRQIAEHSDVLFCLVHSDRKGGTENTILHARELKKKIWIVDDAGHVYLDQNGDSAL